MDERLAGWMDRWVDGEMNRWMDGWSFQGHTSLKFVHRTLHSYHPLIYFPRRFDKEHER